MHLGVGERADMMAYREVLDGHFARPQAAQLVQVLPRLGVFDETADGVVGTAHPALDLEFNVGFEAELWTAHKSVIAKLVLHLTKQDTSSIHVRLGDETGESG